MCLALKYLVGLRQRKLALLALLPLAVMGLDLLPTLAVVLGGHGHQHMDLEWWRNDRTPGLLTTLLFAPHHIAGLVSCIAALTVFACCQHRADENARIYSGDGNVAGANSQPSWGASRARGCW